MMWRASFILILPFASAWTNIKKIAGNNCDATSTCLHVNLDRRSFGANIASAAALALGTTSTLHIQPAAAIGPVKVPLEVLDYKAAICPPSKPIPGEKAMKGMRGLCVTVQAKLTENAPKDLEKVGVYGFVTDAITSDSVLANNPDLSTDAGQFSMIESVTTKDKFVEFEFVAAVPMEKDVSKEENGIGPLSFDGLRIISFPGGQQYGAINPCEMNEFSDECEAWEAENGEYKRGDFMVQSNPRTKGR
mmetsp:Transcript_25248/g.39090  ORF Transcript_25248/g.39090 Transcript_25248/m.39090 type:complete len:248 (+) Transcript_25248:80-823(+)|eukprot:CAMPEP_0196818010 /NCGR_PEP_ID=MMETSP1362-20130617/63649_1 /TAXON_ID=163516 /ORGANISM="Leptocylindrus danicus, Strain CCMP1856" /LENGTH=247 /DNA_ID=CAMNT_0042195919 /DNA_START=64 /DNA_END=807 /DNA_ORIENTATION=+